MDEIKIDKDFYLSPLKDDDIEALVKWLNDKDIYKRTLVIPFPYSEQDAKDFIKYARNKNNKFGRTMEWAIRNSAGELIGVIGLHGNNVSQYKDDIGYWLAKDYWGKGIMTKALKAITNIAVDKYGLVRIEAPIFSFNLHSQKVAEKCGYLNEGTMRKAYYKDGMFFDSKLFAYVKE